jgi:hypothetical protein
MSTKEIYLSTDKNIIRKLIGNDYVHSIWFNDGVFSIKLEGMPTFLFLQEFFDLPFVKKASLPSVPSDYDNQHAIKFIAKTMMPEYLSKVQLLTDFLTFISNVDNRNRLNKDAFSNNGISMLSLLISKTFHTIESTQLVEQLFTITDTKNLELPVPSKVLVKDGIEKIKNLLSFWGYDVNLSIYEVNNKGIAKVVNHRFIKWLSQRGFFAYFINNYCLAVVKVERNIAIRFSTDMLISYITTELEKGDQVSFQCFMDNPNKCINPALLATLPIIETIGLNDDRQTCYKAFRNTVVKITANKIEYVPYEKLEFVIWKDEIINHSISLNTDNQKIKQSKFFRFIDKSIGLTRFIIFGYLSHRYKDPSNAKMVILTDPNPSDAIEKSNGRTGKSIFIDSLSFFNKVIEVDDLGKGRFDLQAVEKEHGIIAFPDAPFNFNYRALFNAITGTMVIEKKQEKSINIPFKESPKIVVATNYALKIESDSYTDRVVNLQFSDFFGLHNRPSDYLGGRLFEDEWTEFYAVCINAVQRWLQNMNFSCIENYFFNIMKHEKLCIGVNLDENKRKRILKHVPIEYYQLFLYKNGLCERKRIVSTGQTKVTQYEIVKSKN